GRWGADRADPAVAQAGLARARLAGLGGGRTAGRRGVPGLYRHTHRGLARRPGRHRQLGRLAGHGVAAGRGRAGDAQRQHAPGGTAAAVTRGVRRYDWRHHRAAKWWRRSWRGRGYLLTGSSSVSSRPGVVLAPGGDPPAPPRARSPRGGPPGGVDPGGRGRRRPGGGRPGARRRGGGRRGVRGGGGGGGGPGAPAEPAWSARRASITGVTTASTMAPPTWNEV